MKKIVGIALIFYCTVAAAQIKVHSHNDYLQTIPLLNAYKEGADQIEADVYLLGDSLVVAHGKKQINPANSLNKLYLKPISAFFAQWDKRVSADRNYTFSLMIDVKQDWPNVYQALQKEIEKYGTVFDRSQSLRAIQIVISGVRPPANTFHTYPDWLYFDGLPNVDYTRSDLKKVAFISDDFKKYSTWNGIGELPLADKEKLQTVIKQAKKIKKPIRFWAAPDTEECWKQLYQLGVNIINTDKVGECKRYLSNLIE